MRLANEVVAIVGNSSRIGLAVAKLAQRESVSNYQFMSIALAGYWAANQTKSVDQSQ
jgi:hypothetical protein